MEWFNVESIEELKELGKFREIGAKVKRDCNGIVNIKLGSWKNLYNSILNLRQLLSDLQGKKVINKTTEKIFSCLINIFRSLKAWYLLFQAWCVLQWHRCR